MMREPELSDWRGALATARFAPNTGMVPVRGRTLLEAQAELERLRALCIDYAMTCGELSKALPEGDPMWAELKALGERIGA